jgi:hypothetical protein
MEKTGCCSPSKSPEMSENGGGCCGPKKQSCCCGQQDGGCSSKCCMMKLCCCMKKYRNVGRLDRAVRAVFGLGLISLVFIGPQTAWGWLGLLPLFSALVGWCGLYTVLGVNSCCKKPCGSNPTPPSATP